MRGEVLGPLLSRSAPSCWDQLKLETGEGGGIAGDFYLAFLLAYVTFLIFPQWTCIICIHVFDTINNSMGKLEQSTQENLDLFFPSSFLLKHSDIWCHPAFKGRIRLKEKGRSNPWYQKVSHPRSTVWWKMHTLWNQAWVCILSLSLVLWLEHIMVLSPCSHINRDNNISQIMLRD